jgi:predicted PP-loop superfamily ATPase
MGLDHIVDPPDLPTDVVILFYDIEAFGIRPRRQSDADRNIVLASLNDAVVHQGYSMPGRCWSAIRRAVLGESRAIRTKLWQVAFGRFLPVSLI